MTRAKLVVAICAAVAVAVALWYALIADHASVRQLQSVRHWDYQLQKINIDRLARAGTDMAVIDYSRDGTGSQAFAPADIDRLKRKPGGGRRLVLAYFSVGEAEEYRYYWRPEWKAERPPWLISENCRWPRNHLVRFWMDGWKDIIFRGPGSYLARIAAAGFDGVYLDRVDAYWDLRMEYPEGRGRMIEFVTELALEARRQKPDMLIVVQNAEDLLSERAYRAVIDGVAKEDLIYGVNGTGVRNEDSMFQWSTMQLQKLARDGKPVFAVEYLNSLDAARAARLELDVMGFRATFPTRALDGDDPFVTAEAGAGSPTPAKPEAGTPEYAATNCK